MPNPSPLAWLASLALVLALAAGAYVYGHASSLFADARSELSEQA